MLDAEAPLHEVRSVEFASRHGGDGDRRQAGGWVCQRGCTGKLSLCEPGSKSMSGGDGRIHGTVWHPWGNCGTSDSAEKTALESLHVGWIHPDEIGHGSRQDVTEKSETG